LQQKYDVLKMGFLMVELLFIKRVRYGLEIIIANILLLSYVIEFLDVLNVWGCLWNSTERNWTQEILACVGKL